MKDKESKTLSSEGISTMKEPGGAGSLEAEPHGGLFNSLKSGSNMPLTIKQ